MSIYKRTKSIRSPKYLEKKRKTRLILSILIPIASLSIISAFILLLRLQWFRVYEVSIVGIKDNGLSSNVIQTMNGSYFKLIPKDSSIILPKSEIIKNLKNSFKNIENIDISRQGLNKIIINIKSKDLVAILCDGFEGDTDQKCYSIDEEGNIFSEYDGDLNNPDLDKYYTSSTTDSGIIDVKVKGERKRKVQICCITTGEQTTPFILIDKNSYVDKNFREVTLEKKVTREVAVEALKKEWANVPFDCKVDLAQAFNLEYTVEERKIITAVYLIPS